jgi:hypothetical protein
MRDLPSTWYARAFPEGHMKVEEDEYDDVVTHITHGPDTWRIRL